MKIGFVIPYFGKFNNYFPLFLKSCEFNKNVDWIIFTDDHGNYNYPSNVKVHYTTFEEMKSFIQSKFEFNISLDKPYKLCDFKPAYGYIFEDYLVKYSAWGYCDTDLIWGKISDFVTDDDLKKYSKIGDLGHCTIIKNEEYLNKAFMMPLYGQKVFRNVFQDSHNHSFDEEYNKSINNIFIQYGLKILRNGERIANIYTKSSDFKLTYMINDSKYFIEKKSKNVFVWNKGYLTRYINYDYGVSKKIYMYIHMQSRPMKVRTNNYNCFKIIPNSFDELEVKKISHIFFPKYKHFNLHYFKLRSSNLIDKIRKRIFD